MSEKMLKKINSLQLLSAESERALLSGMKLKKLNRNSILLAEGEHCKGIYFVESGCLRAAMYKDGREINLSFFLENNFATNLKSLRRDSPSEYYIKACEPSTVWSLNKIDLFELYERSAEISNFGRILLEQLLIEQEDHANFLKINSQAERYAHILKNAPALLQKVSLTQLSSYLGMSRESLSRIRKIK